MHSTVENTKIRKKIIHILNQIKWQPWKFIEPVQQIIEKPFGIYVCSSQKFCLGAMPFTYFAAHFAA
jgi:hypothetical protein